MEDMRRYRINLSHDFETFWEAFYEHPALREIPLVHRAMGDTDGPVAMLSNDDAMWMTPTQYFICTCQPGFYDVCSPIFQSAIVPHDALGQFSSACERCENKEQNK